MPTATNRGVECYYEADGSGPTVAFVGDLGCGAWLWGWQAPALAGPFDTVVPELRGVGRADPVDSYAVDDLAADLEAVLADHGARRAHLVAAGSGGLVALEYAREYARAASLAIVGGAAHGGVFDLDPLTAGPEHLDGLLSEPFRDEHPEAVESIVEWRRAEDAAPDAKGAMANSVETFDARDWLYEVTVPALVLHGAADEVVPVDAGEALAEGLPRGRFDGFADEPHWLFVEQARLVTDRLAGFLEDVTSE